MLSRIAEKTKLVPPASSVSTVCNLSCGMIIFFWYENQYYYKGDSQNGKGGGNTPKIVDHPQQRQYHRPAGDSHDHQCRYLIGSIRLFVQCKGENDGKEIGAGQPDDEDGRQENPPFGCNRQGHKRCNGQQQGYLQKPYWRDLEQQE